MHKMLSKYAKTAHMIMTVPVARLNKIFDDADCGLRIIVLSYFDSCECFNKVFGVDESLPGGYKSFAKVDVINKTIVPTKTLASSILGINLIDWFWDDSGKNIIIQYTDVI